MQYRYYSTLSRWRRIISHMHYLCPKILINILCTSCASITLAFTGYKTAHTVLCAIVHVLKLEQQATMCVFILIHLDQSEKYLVCTSEWNWKKWTRSARVLLSSVYILIPWFETTGLSACICLQIFGPTYILSSVHVRIVMKRTKVRCVNAL